MKRREEKVRWEVRREERGRGEGKEYIERGGGREEEVRRQGERGGGRMIKKGGRGWQGMERK